MRRKGEHIAGSVGTTKINCARTITADPEFHAIRKARVTERRLAIDTDRLERHRPVEVDTTTASGHIEEQQWRPPHNDMGAAELGGDPTQDDPTTHSTWAENKVAKTQFPAGPCSWDSKLFPNLPGR